MASYAVLPSDFSGISSLKCALAASAPAKSSYWADQSQNGAALETPRMLVLTLMGEVPLVTRFRFRAYTLLMATMTAKQVQHLGELHARFSAGTFSETDASALLVLLREKSGGGPIVELAHSIVHAERNSGQFFERIKQNREVLNNLGRKPGVVRGGDVFAYTDFAQNLDETLVRYGFASLAPALYELIFLCSLSLLQGSGVKAGKTFGELSLSHTSDRFALLATTPVTYNGREVSVVFPVASVVNRWIPVCNPRAQLSAHGPVRVSVIESAPVVEGFKPFEVHIEREPPISRSDVRELAVRLGLGEQEDSIVYSPSGKPAMTLNYDGRRLTVRGIPEFFRAGSDYERILKGARLTLGACVHDDAGAHWFLEGLDIAPDGFHCHWVGKGSPTCTRPA